LMKSFFSCKLISGRQLVDKELFFVQWAWQECGGASFVTNNRALGPTDVSKATM